MFTVAEKLAFSSMMAGAKLILSTMPRYKDTIHVHDLSLDDAASEYITELSTTVIPEYQSSRFVGDNIVGVFRYGEDRYGGYPCEVWEFRMEKDGSEFLSGIAEFLIVREE